VREGLRSLSERLVVGRTQEAGDEKQDGERGQETTREAGCLYTYK
jgi:hypothetical protein